MNIVMVIAAVTLIVKHKKIKNRIVMLLSSSDITGDTICLVLDLI